jgi:hypothetical protein
MEGALGLDHREVVAKCYFRFLCLFFRKRFLRLWVAILCLFLFFPLGMIKTLLLHIGFYLAHESFGRLERWNGVLGYNDGGVLGNVPGGLLGPFLDDETSKAPQVHVLIVAERIFHCLHECFDSFLDSHFFDSRVLGNFVYDISFSHF